MTQNYPACKTLITDNDPILVSHAAKAVYRKYKINHITTPVQHSTSNGQVERVHNTLIEIVRCLTKQNSITSSEEIFIAAKAYNETIHSVIGERPIDVKLNPNNFPQIKNRCRNIFIIFMMNLVNCGSYLNVKSANRKCLRRN